jgi:dephospho-CoA kinase
VLNVGLTGNVATGKSTVAHYFERAGATLIDADRLVREVQRPGSPVLAAIADRFGAEMLRADGTLERARLRTHVLDDPTARADLERIVHPAVQARRAQLLADAEARGDLGVVNDIPLLFEALDPGAFDLIVLVDAPAHLRIDRLTRLRGMPPDEAALLIASQIPSEEKRDRAHVVIDNDGDLDALARAAAETWGPIRRTAAARATISGGTLLVVVAHPEDATILLRGTLERYSEAGTAVWLVCATGQCGADLPDGIEITELARPRGMLDPADPAAISALAQLVRQHPPDAVITFGPEGASHQRDHHAVHRWTGAALRASASGCSMYHPLPPDGRVAADRAGIGAALDVRPWRGASAAGPAACGVRYDPDAVPRPWNGREWYTGGDPSAPCRDDLFASQRAG